MKFLQSAIGAGVDGAMGNDTMKHLDIALSITNEEAIIDAYLIERGEFYDDIVERDPTQNRFKLGWENRLNSLREEVA